ncbi:IPP transferase-domain-containing protein [Polychytrium aggregatum]|uniref:IPP transferase-domain-containing protein n=1 Tax=Polychytrium aggregatum TaxID=110093 RepID=UPI0022FDFC7A|nr:IPP transferase-domain-containing protein [Polychytrium aggregatum]KAI9203361.1 IPP transferase-domain-containing protein [Polychytrium aggregatum]
MSQKPPIVVIVGTTGVGKTLLSLQLAERLNGEVISADSMQVYKGLDVITNKATQSERSQVPHHIIDFLDPLEEYSVGDFERDALEAIEAIHARDKVPIIVGGTNYYIQSLLWNRSLVGSDSSLTSEGITTEIGKLVPHASIDKALLKQVAAAIAALEPKGKRLVYPDDEELPKDVDGYKVLQTVDPSLTANRFWYICCGANRTTSASVLEVMAQRWHQNDTRKILRSLEVYYTTGKRHSDIIIAQNSDDSGRSLRFRACVFWIYGEHEQLAPRLDDRVDEMIKLGLFDELNTLFGLAQQKLGGKVDYSRGIFQAIGYKEFDPYLTALHCDPPEEPHELERLKTKGIVEMKQATRRYARKQITWIKNKLAPVCLKEMAFRDSTEASGQAAEATDMAFYILDGSDLKEWPRSVGDKGLSLCDDFINKNVAHDPAKQSPTALAVIATLPQQTAELSGWTKRSCPLCLDSNNEPRVFNGPKEWDVHIHSRNHKRNVGLARERGDDDDVQAVMGQPMRKRGGSPVEDASAASTAPKRGRSDADAQ